MNIVIPMAGQGSRFQAAGYTFPKPLIDVNHKPMIQVVTDNLALDGKHIFLVLKDHYDKYSLKYLLPLIVQPRAAEIVQVDQVTQGAACTVLLARDLIDNDDELVIANSDQWVDWDSRHFLNYMRTREADGGILTFLSTHPKWSFVKVDELSSRIVEVAEKRPISNVATVGVYYFRHGRDFVAAADRMIRNNERVNNEFYVAPTYNEMIADGKSILSYPVAEMKGLGTPEDLERFLSDQKSGRRGL
jgi:dTDP-glucose pyrophosphorylase